MISAPSEAGPVGEMWGLQGRYLTSSALFSPWDNYNHLVTRQISSALGNLTDLQMITDKYFSNRKGAIIDTNITTEGGVFRKEWLSTQFSNLVKLTLYSRSLYISYNKGKARTSCYFDINRSLKWPHVASLFVCILNLTDRQI